MNSKTSSLYDEIQRNLKILNFTQMEVFDAIIKRNETIVPFLQILNFIWIEANEKFKNEIERTYGSFFAKKDVEFVQTVFKSMVNSPIVIIFYFLFRLEKY